MIGLLSFGLLQSVFQRAETTVHVVQLPEARRAAAPF
jgi:hypothetical protein